MRYVILTVIAAAAFAGDRDKAIAASMRKVIDAGEVPGAVTIVATRDGVSYVGVIGHADPDRKQRLKKDSIFWIASMTKPVTAAAILMLEDEGKLSVDDPVSKYVPELKHSGMTLKHLLTHTSGLGEAAPEEMKAAKRLADLIPAYASKKPFFAPGSQWKYCQSGINTLGRIVEIVSGKRFEDFLDERFFRPLGMRDTSFYPPPSKAARIVTPARKDGDKLVPAAVSLLHGRAPSDTDRYPAANGGLYSTGPDYARFARMLLNGGELDGKRYLSEQSVPTMSAPQTGTLKAGFIPGHAWGLGVGVVVEPAGQTAMLKPGTFGHGGAYGTQAWIDPQNGVALILMVQRANFKNSDDSPVRLAFQRAAMGAE
ncbi:MAG: beta-lactamase family protein [Acidobacteria bacterium]|nr:beta-lactamase family protein [Acidobacteriota bacterium]